MRVIARPLAPGEIDYEMVVLAGSVVGFVLAASWFALHLPWPICWFHALTGHPCLTCGATRSAVACVHAEFFTALRWNPLVFLIYCGVVMFDAYAAVVVVLTKSHRVRLYLRDAEKRFVRATVVFVLLVNWGYLLSHSQMFNG